MPPSEIKPRTLKSYTQLLTLHIVPEFSRVRLRDIGRGMIKRFLATKWDAGKPNSESFRPPRSSTRRYTRRCFCSWPHSGLRPGEAFALQ